MTEVFALGRDPDNQPAPRGIEFGDVPHIAVELRSKTLHGLELSGKKRCDVDDELRAP
jgi:hypothetical protein